MKGCISLQRYWAVFGNSIALELKNRYGVKEFCGFITTRQAERYIKAQGDIKYTNLILDEDLHAQYKKEVLDLEFLKKLEAEYGIPNLWPYIAVDRTIMMNIPPKEYSISPTPPFSHEEMLRILQVKFRNIISFLEKERPDFLIMPLIGSLGAMTLYNVAKKMKIKTYTINIGRIKNNVTFTEDYKTLTGTEKIFKKIRNGNYDSPYFSKAKNFLEDFKKNPVSWQTKKVNNENRIKNIVNIPLKIFKSIKFLIRSIIQYLKDPHTDDKTTDNPWYAFTNKIILRLRSLRNLNKLYDEPKQGEDFAYFPLHFQPEMTIDLIAPFYTNQITLLNQISKSLPINFKLYVKEHPMMVNYRPTKYYKELKKIPNIKLINTTTDSFELIKNSKIILTITGTIGWEAAMLGKPVITFGDVFFNNLTAVKKCMAIEDLPYIIKERLENYTFNEKEIIDMLSAIFEDMVNFDYMKLWAKGDFGQIKNNPDFPKFVDILAKKLNLFNKI